MMHSPDSVLVSTTLSDQEIRVADDASCLAGDTVDGPVSEPADGYGALIVLEAAKETVLEIMPVEVLQQFAVDAPDDPGVSNP